MAVFCLLLGLLLSVAIEDCRGASYKLYPYLYATKDDAKNEASFPVIDHIAPEKSKERVLDKPDFLYNKSPDTYRVVEFYVHWCGICRHFSKRYVEYARKVLKLTEGKAKVTFHAISCVPNRFICKMQKTSGYPMLRLLKPGETSGGVDLRHTDTNVMAILRILGLYEEGMIDFDEEVIEEKESHPKLSLWSKLFGKQTTLQRKATKKRTREDLRNDIHLSFDFSMRNNIYMTDEDDNLSEEEKKALKNYLVLLRRTMPSAWKEFHELLDKLLRNFHYVVRKEKYLIRFLDSHKPKGLVDDEAIWSPSCSNGEAGSGFTCGLWETFHVATVGMVHFNKEQVDESLLLAPENVARTIRDFIDHFFQCSECRENFLRMYDSCGHNRCDRLKKRAKLGAKVAETEEQQIVEWEETSLWFFEVHNAVNVRLLRERGEREGQKITVNDVIEAHWPSYSECSPCWESFDPTSGLGVPNGTITLQYLHLEYGHRDESMANFQEFLASANQEKLKMLEVQPNRPVNGLLLRLWVLGLTFAVYSALGGKVQIPHSFRRILTRKARTM